MKTVALGRHGPALSVLGFGAMSLSDFYGPVSDTEGFAVLDAAVAGGITHIDTANVYGMGRSEATIGAWLRANPGLRDRLVIATKAGIQHLPGGRVLNNDPAYLEGELDASLTRLGVDCVDLFYVHRRQHDIPIEAVTETLARLIARGKTRAIGFSEIAPASLRRAAAVHHIDAVQSEYSLQTRAPDLGLVQTCAELGTALVAFSPVGRSLLTDRPATPERVAANPFLRQNPRFMAPNLAANLVLTDRFRALAAEMGTTAAALAIAWLLTRGDHVLPIPGTRYPAHLAECLAGAALHLSADDLARIEAVLPPGWAHGDRYSDAQWIGPEHYG